MSKNVDEIAADILVAALASKAVTTTGMGASYQANEIASAYRIIREAVASDVPPPPLP